MRFDPTVEGVDGVAQFADGDAVVGQLDPVGGHPDLGRAKFQSRFGADLGAFAAGQGLVDQSDGLQRHVQDFFKPRPRNIQFDGPGTADAAPKKRSLRDRPEGSRLAVDRALQHRDQFPDPGRVLGGGANEGAATRRNKEETL